MVNNFHQELVKIIERVASKGPKSSENANYLGSLHPHYGLSVPQKQKIAKDWVFRHKNLTNKEFINLINSLYEGKSYEEMTLASSLIRQYSKLRVDLNPKLLDHWLEKLDGWAEIDSLCQSIFTAEEILSNWKIWQLLIKDFCQNKNLSKNRASLVLLTGPVKKSSDKRLGQLAFSTINTLKSKKEILITKSISWLLRALIKNFRLQVEAYIKDNVNDLPKIAVWETLNKLKTNKKT